MFLSKDDTLDRLIADQNNLFTEEQSNIKQIQALEARNQEIDKQSNLNKPKIINEMNRRIS